MQKYAHKKIEKKWQKVWKDKKIYKTKDGGKKPKCYVLDMFPYPSGEGLHVGHPRGYIATDVYSRFKRMNGFNVLHPMGFDSFGLPAENYALKNKIHPEIAVKNNIKKFKKQLELIGFDYDWDREIITSDSRFYKWTQWLFLKMFEKGLAYESYEPINFCPSCLTGLANEDVEDGKCERCGTPVIKKPMRQWMLKITDYAERLLEDLDELKNWPEHIKEAQRNWIGRSKGAEIDFSVVETGPKPNFLILHGYTGRTDKNFIPWLKQELEKKGYHVQSPQMPNTDNPTEGEQVSYVLDNCQIDENTIVVGHSLGAIVAMKVLIKLGSPIRGLILVAAAMDPASQTTESRLFHKTFNWDIDFNLLKKTAVFRIVLSDLTENKRINYLEKLAKNLDANLITGVAMKEHFTAKEEPLILKIIIPSIKIFTTRIDTIFGCTYVVVAPENKIIDELREKIKNWDEVKKYVEEAKNKSDLQRTDLTKEKTGVELKGVKAVNPFTGEEIPVWVADYVLGGYGTGAVMAVPAHDERDWEFAKKYNLPIKEVIVPYLENKKFPMKDGAPLVPRKNVDCILRNPKNDEYAALKWNEKYGWTTLIGGGVEEGEDIIETGVREIREETGYKNIKFIKVIGRSFGGGFAAHKGENRLSDITCLLFELVDDSKEEIDKKEKEKHQVVWVKKGKMSDFLNVESSNYLWSLYLNGFRCFTGGGRIINSGQFESMDSVTAREKMTEWLEEKKLGGKKINYKLKDWVFSRQRYWGEPIPLVFCENCAVKIKSQISNLKNEYSMGELLNPGWIADENLPVRLPRVKFYEPTDTGESPLAKMEKWVNVKCPKCGGKGKREINTMPQWAGSSWYYLRYIDPRNKKALVDEKKEKYWSPVDMYVGGTEHATRHLIYARFWHKFLFDIGAVSCREPFAGLKNQGLILGSDGRKMSKRWGNVVNPDDVVAQFGADTLRIYEMFMGPFDQPISWSADSIVGSRRFLERVYSLSLKIKSKISRPQRLRATMAGVANLKTENSKLENLLHKTIKKVTEDIENFHFNTAISSLMILLNEMEKEESLEIENYKLLLKLLSPFAPHIAEEIWSDLDGKKSIHLEKWAKCDESKLETDETTIVVQINGKVRANFIMDKNKETKEMEAIALSLPEVNKWLDGKQIKKIFSVKGKIVSIVI